jgi:uncharacterized membrane-anchored protein YhcB (DUF1043 family)
MKNKIVITSVIVLIVGLLGGYAIASFSKNKSSNLAQNQNGMGQRQNLNKANCLSD